MKETGSQTKYDRFAEYRAIRMYVWRYFKQATHFRASIFEQFGQALTGIIIYSMIAEMGKEALQGFMGGVGGDYVSFVILGMVFNYLLAASTSAAYQGTLSAYWNGRLELLLLSSTSLPVFVIGTSLASYIQAAINVVILLFAGSLIFGLTLSSTANYGLAFLFILLGILAAMGVGLISASMISFLDARGGDDPVRFLVELLVGLGAGVYYPVSYLPKGLQLAASLIPHTYVYDGARRALLSSNPTGTLPLHSILPVPPIFCDLLVTILFASLLLPIGWKTYVYSIELAKKDGRLSRWV